MAKLREREAPRHVNGKSSGRSSDGKSDVGHTEQKSAHNGKAATDSANGTERQSAPQFCGLPMKWVSLVALTFQTSWQVFVIKFARAGSGKYLNTTVVLFAEILKTLISIAMLAVEQGSLSSALMTLRQQCLGNLTGTLRFCIPALAYTIMNNLVFLSLDKLSAAVQQITYQLKILAAAGLSVVMLRKSMNATQWSSLVLLVIGVALVQRPGTAQASPAPAEFTVGADPVVGLIAVLSACFMGGFGGVYMEMVLKQAGASMWLRNAQLGFFGALFALLGVYATDGDRVQEGGLLQGFSWRACLAVFTLATGGLLVATVIKYADNILRQFSTAMSIIITSAYSAFILQEYEPDLLFVLGALIAISAGFLYSLGLPRWLVWK